jgi:hypothetical protein
VKEGGIQNQRLKKFNQFDAAPQHFDNMTLCQLGILPTD